jgi:hypothetical protein
MEMRGEGCVGFGDVGRETRRDETGREIWGREAEVAHYLGRCGERWHVTRSFFLYLSK